MTEINTYEGGCLCGAIRYAVTAEPVVPHICSCTMCSKWTGAPTVGWVEFPIAALRWTGEAGKPRCYRSSPVTRRCNCPTCGSAICAYDDDYENISIVLGSLDDPNLIVPDENHSYDWSVPNWWYPEVKAPIDR